MEIIVELNNEEVYTYHNGSLNLDKRVSEKSDTEDKYDNPDYSSSSLKELDKVYFGCFVIPNKRTNIQNLINLSAITKEYEKREVTDPKERLSQEEYDEKVEEAFLEFTEKTFGGFTDQELDNRFFEYLGVKNFKKDEGVMQWLNTILEEYKRCEVNDPMSRDLSQDEIDELRYKGVQRHADNKDYSDDSTEQIGGRFLEILKTKDFREDVYLLAELNAIRKEYKKRGLEDPLDSINKFNQKEKAKLKTEEEKRKAEKKWLQFWK